MEKGIIRTEHAQPIVTERTAQPIIEGSSKSTFTKETFVNQPIITGSTSTHTHTSKEQNLGTTAVGLATAMETGLASSHTHAHTHSDKHSSDSDYEEYEEYEVVDPHTGVVVKKKRGLGTKIKDAVKGVFGGKKTHKYEVKHI